jgi:hypothetical protein
MSAVEVESRTRPLHAADRCDRCQAAALTVARNHKERELFFCEHHARLYKESLISKGFYLDVETLDLREGQPARV